MGEIKAIAMPGTHQKFLKYFEQQSFDTDTNLLDIGAGHGAFTKALHDKGFKVQACDLDPSIFYFDQIQCTQADITKTLPYEDNSVDIAIAIEVSEHILDHEQFFAEVNRVLKPGGSFFLSTPNILSLKSRIRFLFRGFYYGFGPLDFNNYDGMQHIASRTVNQYQYIGVKHGFNTAQYAIDRRQSSSRWILAFIKPFIWFNTIIKKAPIIHNNRDLLLGRLLFLHFKKK